MKNLPLLSLLLFSLVVTPALASDWITGTVTNPGAGVVVADTGPLPADGNYRWCVWGAASVGAILRVQHRNAANDANLHEFYMPVGSTQSPIQVCATADFAPLILQDERLRLVNNSLIVGTISASILRSEP